MKSKQSSDKEATSCCRTVPALALVVTPRIVLLCLSFVVDGAVWSSCSNRSAGREALFWLRTSWPFLVFASKPFSNTAELILVALCWHCTVVARRPRTKTFAALVALGTFTRITFIAFALPLALHALYRLRLDLFAAHRKRTDGDAHPGPPSRYQLRAALQVALSMAVCFSVACVAIVAFDTSTSALVHHCPLPRDTAVTTTNVRSPLLDPRPCVHFDRGRSSSSSAVKGNGVLVAVRSLWESGMRPVVAPWHNVVYNLDTNNLAKHGLHPRYHHVLINMHLLFGPLFPMFLHQLARGRLSGGLVVVAAVVLLPLGLLSLFPHQEPRFLLPLVLPLALTAAHTPVPRRIKAPLKLSWIFFNSVMVGLYGGLHQAGVVPALLDIQHDQHHHVQQQQGDNRLCVAAVKVYSLPQFILGLNTNEAVQDPLVRNFGSTPPDLVAHVLRDHVRDRMVGRSGSRPRKDDAHSSTAIDCPSGWTLLVPGSVEDVTLAALRRAGLYAERRNAYFPHLTMEALPNVFNPRALSVDAFSLMRYHVQV